MGSIRLLFYRTREALSVLALLVVASSSSAQDFQDVAQATAAPPHLAFVDGSATLEREGQAETAVSGMPFVPGDRLQTTRGRIEILFADGSTLAVDEFTVIELQDLTIVRLTAGRLLLTVAGVNDPAAAQRYQIDTPAASASTDGPGEYRIALMNGRGTLETELAVFRGYATLATDVGSTAVRAGERTLARDLYAPSHPLPFNSARFDAFELWAAARRDARLGTASARYLPRDLYAYSNTFDRYGSWSHEGSYGYVWYPTVAAGWRPYHHGYWSPLRRYGWTWIGYDIWGWPTHHYGRWGYARNRWFWIPGRHWGPAWVSWASAPGFVGWCPLGFDSRPVFALSVINPWNGWVVVSRPHFGHRFAVHQYALAPAAIPARTSFVVAPKAPLALPPSAAPRAIPRPPATAPVQRAGARVVPRGGSAVTSTPGSAPATPPASGVVNGLAPAGARARQAVPRGAASTPDAQANVNRYVPDTTTLGGRRASAVRESDSVQQTGRQTTPRSATPRWYPPVTMAPRVEPNRTPAQPSAPAAPPRWETNPGFRRSAPPTTITPNQPELSAPGRVPGAAPWSAQPRRSVEPPSSLSPQRAPQVSPRSAPPPSARPPDASPSRAPMAVPRAAPQGAAGAAPRAAAPPPSGGSSQAAPAQPSGERQAPAGARPRSR
jgi:hypothetical protein